MIASASGRGYLRQVGETEWRTRYAVKFEEKVRVAWQGSYDRSFREFDQKQIAPLAKAHAQWMESKALRSPFQGFFDREDPESGAVYTATFVRCIADTQDKKPCFDLGLK